MAAAIPLSAAWAPPLASALSRDPGAVRQRLVMLERLLEGLVRLPGNQRMGLDSALGFIPVVGDIVSATLGLYLVWEARNLGLPRWRCARMLGRVGFDTLIGAVPVVGDLFDFFYRSNSRNLKALIAHVDRIHPGSALVEGRRL